MDCGPAHLAAGYTATTASKSVQLQRSRRRLEAPSSAGFPQCRQETRCIGAAGLGALVGHLHTCTDAAPGTVMQAKSPATVAKHRYRPARSTSWSEGAPVHRELIDSPPVAAACAAAPSCFIQQLPGTEPESHRFKTAESGHPSPLTPRCPAAATGQSRPAPLQGLLRSWRPLPRRLSSHAPTPVRPASAAKGKISPSFQVAAHLQAAGSQRTGSSHQNHHMQRNHSAHRQGPLQLRLQQLWRWPPRGVGVGGQGQRQPDGGCAILRAAQPLERGGRPRALRLQPAAGGQASVAVGALLDAAGTVEGARCRLCVQTVRVPRHLRLVSRAAPAAG